MGKFLNSCSWGDIVNLIIPQLSLSEFLMINATQHPSYSYLADMNKDAIIFPEFTQAFLGAGTNGSKSVAVYDFNQCVIQLVGQEDMKPSEAKEFLFLNVISQTNSENSPMFLITNPIVEELMFFG